MELEVFFDDDTLALALAIAFAFENEENNRLKLKDLKIINDVNCDLGLD